MSETESIPIKKDIIIDIDDAKEKRANLIATNIRLNNIIQEYRDKANDLIATKELMLVNAPITNISSDDFQKYYKSDSIKSNNSNKKYFLIYEQIEEGVDEYCEYVELKSYYDFMGIQIKNDFELIMQAIFSDLNSDKTLVSIEAQLSVRRYCLNKIVVVTNKDGSKLPLFLLNTKLDRLSKSHSSHIIKTANYAISKYDEMVNKLDQNHNELVGIRKKIRELDEKVVQNNEEVARLEVILVGDFTRKVIEEAVEKEQSEQSQ